ncbi:MAG TPA: cyanophycinase, partial [Symbiobacteriaceae bacterium]|nr:cyanophycinase [Symbiobacteriaceae bacterium]
MKLDRLSDITSELSSSLVRSIVLPGGLLEWLSKPLPGRLRDRLRAGLSRSVASSEPLQRAKPASAGPLVLMGGTPVPDESIVAMIHLSGGRTARLAIVPAATREHARVAEQGTRLFTRFGMKNVHVLELTTRERAESPEWAADLANCDAVFLCGDDESVGLEVLYGSLAAKTLKAMQVAGKPVAGLAAGAAILADRVLLHQDGQDVLAKGLGLAPGLMIDTHFTQQSRFSHMARALNGEDAAGLMGMGMDAGAAVALRNGEAKVLGEGSVTFLDLKDTMVIPDPSVMPPGALMGMKVHVLMDGYVMNLRSRKPGAG